MTTQTKPRNMSHSKLQVIPDPFDAHSKGCFRKYAYSYLFDVPQAPDAAAIVGTGYHAALQADGLHKFAGNGDLSLAELIDIGRLATAADLHVRDAERTLIGVEANMMQRLETLIGVYHRYVQPYYKPGKPPELKFNIELPGVNFGGLVDAFGKTQADGSFKILDWKQTKFIRNPKWIGTKYDLEWIDDPEHTDQATAYMMAYPQASAVQFIVTACDPLYPETGTLKRYEIARDAEREKRYRARILRTNDAITMAERSGSYPATVSKLCGWCRYIGVCPAGQAALAADGKEPQVHTPPHVVPCDACKDGKADVTNYLVDSDGARLAVRCRDCGVIAEQKVIKKWREAPNEGGKLVS